MNNLLVQPSISRNNTNQQVEPQNSSNMNPWVQAGAQALGSAGGGLLGGLTDAIFGKGRAKRQLKYQTQLMERQNANSKDLAEYQYDMEMRKWEETNYKAQTDQMRKAGLNVGLMYDGGGQGGTTATAGMPSGAPAGQYQDTNSIGIGMELGQRTAMQNAQIDLINAQKENVEADTEKKKGVDTQLLQTQIESLTQGIENQKAIETATNLDNDIKRIEYKVRNETLEDAIDTVKYNAKSAYEELRLIRTEANFNEETYKTKAETLTANLALIIGQKANIESSTKVNESIVKYAKTYASVALMNASANQQNADANTQNAGINQQNANINQTRLGIDAKRQTADAQRVGNDYELTKARTELEKELGEAKITNDRVQLIINGINTIGNLIPK